MSNPTLKPWMPQSETRAVRASTWNIILIVFLAATSALGIKQAVQLEGVIDAKVQAEKEVAELRQRPHLSAWEPVEITYYADSFHGRTTANGSTFSQGLPTCATSIPALMGRVVVIRGANGLLIPAIVTDILPEQRMDRLDVSRHIAQRLGIIKQGRITLSVAALQEVALP